MRGGAQIALALLVASVLGCHAERRPPTRLAAPPPPPTPPVEAAIAERLAVYGPLARDRLHPYFAAAGVPYPPARFVLLGLKQERELQLYAAGQAQPLRFIRSFPILGASGRLGPKLKEGDFQVPEGIYGIVYLNPRSIAHLSLALSYPNDFDRARAVEDGRDPTTLGSAIMIHGGWKSVGCLAVGDPAAEDLFVLAADAGFDSAVVMISPVDFRRATLPLGYRAPAPWVGQLYGQLRTRMLRLPAPPAATRAVTADTR
ncbi:hypothetical protein KF840_19215 [bacterium]|nr:hypothetical protein [bacterium]